MPLEHAADEQIDERVPLTPSGTVWDPSSTCDPYPSADSVAVAEPPTPSQQEVDAAWPAPSTDNADTVDTWGAGITVVADKTSGDPWGASNAATAPNTWVAEAKGGNANNGWSSGGGQKSNDRGYGGGGPRRGRPFWQPPEVDGMDSASVAGTSRSASLCLILYLFHRTDVYPQV